MNKLPIELLIFDWDGTLVDSLGTIVTAHIEAARQLDLLIPESTRIKALIGLSADEVVRVLYPSRTPASYEEIIQTYRTHYFENANKIFLYPGVKETIQQLHAQGYQLAVATGKSRIGLDAGLRDTDLGQYFTTTKTAEETASKPHPLMIQEILTQTDLASSQAIMIGDTEYDMQLANNAGIKAVAVDYGAHSREMLLKHLPYACISDIRELLSLINAETT
jgi:phosphoglycolate phosphatase